MAHLDRARLLIRRPRRRGALPAAGKQHLQLAVSLERALRLPAMDRMLGRAVSHPRLLQWLGALLGLMSIGLALWPFLVSSARSASTTGPVQGSSSAVVQLSTTNGDADPHGANAEQSDLVAVVAAYNQASITAALLGRADVMAPYLAPDGTAWKEVQAEYQRRATRAETHEPTLTRWGALREEIAGDTARVETQEQWDDITSVGGEVISSRRGPRLSAMRPRNGPESADVIDVILDATTIVLWDQPSSALIAGRKMPKTKPPVPAPMKGMTIFATLFQAAWGQVCRPRARAASIRVCRNMP